jgi:hypothetical protein
LKRRPAEVKNEEGEHTMRDDYKVTGSTDKLSAEVEAEILHTLRMMSEYTNLSISEITNTALKRFVSGHKDFLPPKKPARKAG